MVNADRTVAKSRCDVFDPGIARLKNVAIGVHRICAFRLRLGHAFLSPGAICAALSLNAALCLCDQTELLTRSVILWGRRSTPGPQGKSR